MARTLCPLESDHKHPGVFDQEIIIDVSTAAEKDVDFELRTMIVPKFEVQYVTLISIATVFIYIK